MLQNFIILFFRFLNKIKVKKKNQQCRSVNWAKFSSLFLFCRFSQINLRAKIFVCDPVKQETWSLLSNKLPGLNEKKFRKKTGNFCGVNEM